VAFVIDYKYLYSVQYLSTPDGPILRLATKTVLSATCLIQSFSLSHIAAEARQVGSAHGEEEVVAPLWSPTIPRFFSGLRV
jgi:hypothetical protein